MAMGGNRTIDFAIDIISSIAAPVPMTTQDGLFASVDAPAVRPMIAAGSLIPEMGHGTWTLALCGQRVIR
jgi:hypothetical protein